MNLKPLSDPPSCTADILALQDTLQIIGGKWTLLIIHYLLARKDGIVTFKKIENDIPGLSAKVLTSELKKLEANQLVNRTHLSTKPVSIKYEATLHAETLKDIITQLVAWGSNHRITLFKQ